MWQRHLLHRRYSSTIPFSSFLVGICTPAQTLTTMECEFVLGIVALTRSFIQSKYSLNTKYCKLAPDKLPLSLLFTISTAPRCPLYDCPCYAALHVIKHHSKTRNYATPLTAGTTTPSSATPPAQSARTTSARRPSAAS